MGKQFPFVVIQDGWLPEPFESLEEAKQHRDRLELEATSAGTNTRVNIYRLLLAFVLVVTAVIDQCRVDDLVDALT